MIFSARGGYVAGPVFLVEFIYVGQRYSLFLDLDQHPFDIDLVFVAGVVGGMLCPFVEDFTTQPLQRGGMPYIFSHKNVEHVHRFVIFALAAIRFHLFGQFRDGPRFLFHLGDAQLFETFGVLVGLLGDSSGVDYSFAVAGLFEFLAGRLFPI